jgi:mono/diheme cytochrome c family protein
MFLVKEATMSRRIVLIALSALLGVFAVIQLVPYRVQNPLVTQEPAWDSPQTEALARRACFDCHSNEVRTPWYGHVAPVAWVIRNHVDEGREYVNFSEMDRPQPEAHESGEEVLEGEMPPNYYTLFHSEAQLTDAEWQLLAAGLDATLGGDSGHEGDEH